MSDTSDTEFFTIDKQLYELKALNTYIKDIPGDRWAYRAQPSEYTLQTTFERECLKSGISNEKRADVENAMIRQFKRLYSGIDRQEVISDTLYCLSIMRHYGAPVRLLDFTYSKNIVMYFALEEAYNNIPRKIKEGSTSPDYHEKRECSIWSLDTSDLARAAEKQYKNDKTVGLIKTREKEDEKRTEKTFAPLYLKNKYCFIAWENPIRQHERLHLQQGLFLCQGDITKSFMENLRRCYPAGKTDKIRRVTCYLTPKEIQEGLEECRKMNISRESLFPGLDGLTSAMSYQLGVFQKLKRWRNET